LAASRAAGDNQTAAGFAEPVGCNRDRLPWCDRVRPLSPWVFYGAWVVCLGLAFSSINVALNTIFSRVIGPRRQASFFNCFYIFFLY
jgi:hypothetical protein